MGGSPRQRICVPEGAYLKRLTNALAARSKAGGDLGFARHDTRNRHYDSHHSGRSPKEEKAFQQGAMPSVGRGTETLRGRPGQQSSQDNSARERASASTSPPLSPAPQRSMSPNYDYGNTPGKSPSPQGRPKSVPLLGNPFLYPSPLAKSLLNLNASDATSGGQTLVLSRPRSSSRRPSDADLSAGLEFFDLAKADRDRLQHPPLNKSAGTSHGRSHSAPPPTRPSTRPAPRSLSVPWNGNSMSASPHHRTSAMQVPGAPHGTSRGSSPMYLPSRPSTPMSTTPLRQSPTPAQSSGFRQPSTGRALRDRSLTPFFTTKLKDIIEAAKPEDAERTRRSFSASSSALEPLRQLSPDGGCGSPAPDENRGRSNVPRAIRPKRPWEASPSAPTARRTKGRP